MTVKELKEALSLFEDNMDVITVDGLPIVKIKLDDMYSEEKKVMLIG